MLVDPGDTQLEQDKQVLELQEFKTRIAEVKDSIVNGARTIGSSGSTVINLQQFFDFRDADRLLPFIGNDVSGLFPDSKFNSVVLSPDLNKDLADENGVPRADGIPDILQ